MQSIDENFQFNPLDELLLIGMEQVRRFLPFYAAWPGSKQENIDALQNVFISAASVLKGECEAVVDGEMCEAAYHASARAAAGFRKSKTDSAQLAVYAGTVTSSVADAIIDRHRDPEAAKMSITLAISVALKAEKMLAEM